MRNGDFIRGIIRHPRVIQRISNLPRIPNGLESFRSTRPITSIPAQPSKTPCQISEKSDVPIPKRRKLDILMSDLHTASVERRDYQKLQKFGERASWFFRHAARKFGVQVVPDGFLRVNDVLRQEYFSQLSFDEFKDLCYNNVKDSFEMAVLPDVVDGEPKQVLWVRSRRLHSIPGVHYTFKRILKIDSLEPGVVYEAVRESMDDILEHGIRESELNLIPLRRVSGTGFVEGEMPNDYKSLLVVINPVKAAELGVMFFRDKDKKIYAVGPKDIRGIPPEACRTIFNLEIDEVELVPTKGSPPDEPSEQTS